MDILNLCQTIGDAHYASLKQDPPPLPVKESPMMRLRELLNGCSMHPTRFREIMGCVMEIEAAAWRRGVQDGKEPTNG